jgi:hypothetical protein
MHYLQHLLQRMLPLTFILFNEKDLSPEGFDYVITNTNKFVVTSRGSSVVAKAY